MYVCIGGEWVLRLVGVAKQHKRVECVCVYLELKIPRKFSKGPVINTKIIIIWVWTLAIDYLSNRAGHRPGKDLNWKCSVSFFTLQHCDFFPPNVYTPKMIQNSPNLASWSELATKMLWNMEKMAKLSLRAILTGTSKRLNSTGGYFHLSEIIYYYNTHNDRQRLYQYH